jgi:hypothetical protein
MEQARLIDATVQIPHTARTFFQRPDRVADPLYVVTVIFNPIRFRSRWRLYQDFEKRVSEAGGILYTVEAAFGNRDFAVTDAGNPRHIQVRSQSELWLKENLINIGIQRLPSDWKYVAWVDADVTFVRDDWANETLHVLQHHPVCQMWTEGMDMSPDHTPFAHYHSFAWCYQNAPLMPIPPGGDYYYMPQAAGKKGIYWHAGYAWAARRSAIDQLGGLIDWAVAGSADYHMAYALVNRAKETIQNPNISASYRAGVLEWQARAERYIKRDLGYVQGLVLHHWHGKKANRAYRTRWSALKGFDPPYDLKKDWQGIHQLTDRNNELRDGLRAYFNARNEDSTDM